MSEMINAGMGNGGVAENNNGGAGAAVWQASDAMEKRIVACLSRFKKERCVRGAWKKMSSTQIIEVHAEAKSGGWPNLLTALHKLGCADNAVNKIFAKHGLEPLNVRGAAKKEPGPLEEIKHIDEQIKELRERRSKIAQQAREQVEAEQQALNEKMALLNAVNE